MRFQLVADGHYLERNPFFVHSLCLAKLLVAVLTLLPRVRPCRRVGLIHLVHNNLTTVARCASVIAAYLAKLVESKKFNVWLVSRSSFSGDFLLLNLLPDFRVDSKSLHLVSYFLHHVAWGVRHAADILHALELFTKVFLNRLDEVVQVREVVNWVFLNATLL